MPEIRFTIRHAAVEDIFALTATNTGYVEWELDQKDQGGKHHHATGVTKFRVEGGKNRHGKDYVFDQVVAAAAYPHNTASIQSLVPWRGLSPAVTKTLAAGHVEKAQRWVEAAYQAEKDLPEAEAMSR